MGDQLGACHRSQIKNYFDRIRCGGWDSMGAGRSPKKKKVTGLPKGKCCSSKAGWVTKSAFPLI